MEADNRCSKHNKYHSNKRRPLLSKEAHLVVEEALLVEGLLVAEEVLLVEEPRPLNSKPKRQHRHLRWEEMVH